MTVRPSDSVPVFSSVTGVPTDPSKVDAILVIMPDTRPLRPSDPKFGLSTAAKIAHERVQRDEWQAQRNAAIARQRARENAKREARLAELDAEVERLNQAIQTNTASNIDKAREMLAKAVTKRNLLAAK